MSSFSQYLFASPARFLLAAIMAAIAVGLIIGEVLSRTMLPPVAPADTIASGGHQKAAARRPTKVAATADPPRESAISEPSINLTLAGVLAGNTAAQSQALIMIDNTAARTYRPGEQIGETDYVLHAIQDNSVLVARGERIIRLPLVRAAAVPRDREILQREGRVFPF